MNENQLVSIWINKVLNEHFKAEKKQGTDKLFIKITGLNQENIEVLLNSFREEKTRRPEQPDDYTRKIRTITPIWNYEEFSYQGIETSTWLRNNTKNGEALILIINEVTPEGQSLENLFTIDESYLLSNIGLQSLFNAFAEKGYLSSDELKSLGDFLNKLKKISEPQLRSVVEFLVNIINDPSPSIVDKIQKNLPSLNLFIDSALQLKDITRLKKNFALANLQKGNSTLDTEKLQDRLYTFLEEEEKEGHVSEIWRKKTPDEFTKEALSFFDNSSKVFLRNEFNLIEKVFHFKVKKNINDQLKDIIEEHEFKDQKEKEDFQKGYDEIVQGNDPDAIEGFIDEFHDVLNEKTGLVKRLNRVVDKLRNPSEYEDLYYGILREIFLFIEDHPEKSELDKVSFKLAIKNTKLPESILSLQKLYLLNIDKNIHRLSFEASSLPQEDPQETDVEVTYNLSFIIGDKVVEDRKFKISGFEKLNVTKLCNVIKEDNIIPYIKNYSDSNIEVLDVANYTESKVKHYLTGNEEQMHVHFRNFQQFLNDYRGYLNVAINEGISSIRMDVLEPKIKELLDNVYVSTKVAQHIYQNINLIGAIEDYDVKKGEVGIPVNRLLTVLNPIRLVAMIQKYKEIDAQIEKWLESAQIEGVNVEKLDDYLGYVNEKLSNLAPRYFSTNQGKVYLIEQSTLLGEGQFVRSNHMDSSNASIITELPQVLVKAIKSYLDVYPYSKDGLDMLMLYCQDENIVTKSVEEIFNKTAVKKLRLTVHSEQAAKLHWKLNTWLEQKEEYSKPTEDSKFPKLELNIISGSKLSTIKDAINQRMTDADLVVLADYFSQTNQLNYDYEKVEPKITDSWFSTLYKEPLNDDEAVKRISMVSEHMPMLLQSFYQMQYMVDTNIMPDREHINVLKNIIAISNMENNALIDFMHEKFNWVIILDKYLDKTLLQKASANANIIQYKPKAGTNNEFKLIVSSSEYIKKLSDKASDFAYYDRLHRKLISILKNNDISRDEVISAVNIVKNISGALVLKVIGKGKYAHEMLATYLSAKRRSNQDTAKLQVWSSCDDLPWFANNKRRPDLSLMTIYEEDEQLHLDFDLIELKFINENIFDRERHDAIKQVESGKNLVDKLFNFSIPQLDSEFWRSELIQYLIEKNAYKPVYIQILKKLQHIRLEDIQVKIRGCADVYCYTSNLTDNSFSKIEDGVYFEEKQSDINNYMFTRSYILNQLHAPESTTPSYSELNESDQNERQELEKFIEEEKNNDIVNDNNDDISAGENLDIGINESHDPTKGNQDGESPSVLIDDGLPGKGGDDTTDPADSEYPEVIALNNLEIDYPDNTKNNEELKNNYIRKLSLNFNNNGLHVGVKDSIVGSSVIRLILNTPSDIPFSRISNRSKDMQIWLGINQEPHIFIDKNGVNVDIIREDPDTIYFEKFLQIVREQIQDKITETNLVAPLGLDPLNNVIYTDFSKPMSPHLLAGGTSGSGKSVTINSIILSMMCLYTEEQVQFFFIDPKKVEFTMFKNKRHTIDVVTDIEEAVLKLDELVDEMEKRYTVFEEKGATNLEEYTKYCKGKMPRIVLVFDEFADFMTGSSDTKKQVEEAIQRLGAKARAAGIHLIVSTQSPKADIINTNIRNNLPCRLALKTADATASTVILDETGAEKLAGLGDFLAKIDGQGGHVMRGKSPFLTPQVRMALLNYFAK